ncbi:MAG TPA: hypothetical protein IGS53_16090 [Leptolyngbyaceae cyanobacterium M33_DOE_097]|nr:hypothetical protein [Leptolyngbyaceae cyanobacterium M33_DOE_097]
MKRRLVYLLISAQVVFDVGVMVYLQVQSAWQREATQAIQAFVQQLYQRST